MKVLVCLAVVCSVWLGVAQGRSVPYHSSEELYWGNTFNRGPYLSHSSEEDWWGWNGFGRGGVWDNTNRNLGTDWNFLFNTGVNTDRGTDWIRWMNSNNAGREVEEPTVDNNITPVDHEVSGDQEVTTEPNIPSESDITTENSLGLNDFEPDGAWRTSNRNLETDWNILFNPEVNTNWGTDWMNSNNNGGEGGEPTVVNNTPDDQEVLRGQEVTTESNVPSESDITTENSWGWNGFGADGVWDNTNRNLGADWNSLFNTDVSTNWGTDWMNSDNAGREGEEPTVSSSNAPDGQEISIGQEDVTEPSILSESDTTTDSLSQVGYDITNGGDAPGDVEVIVLEYDDTFPETVHELIDRLRSLDNWQ